MNKLTKQQYRCQHRHNGYEHPLCYQKYQTETPLKIGYFDIEASQLKADFGWLISWVIKHQNQNKYEGYILTKKDYRSQHRDKTAIQKLIIALQKFDKIVTYYGTGFDIPFVRTRALIHNLQFIPPKTILHLDLYYQVRSKLKLARNRLANVGEVFRLTKKTPVDTNIWANVGLNYNKKALQYIWDHNIKDTILLEDAHNLLKPYIPIRRTYL